MGKKLEQKDILLFNLDVLRCANGGVGGVSYVKSIESSRGTKSPGMYMLLIYLYQLPPIVSVSSAEFYENSIDDVSLDITN